MTYTELDLTTAVTTDDAVIAGGTVTFPNAADVGGFMSTMVIPGLVREAGKRYLFKFDIVTLDPITTDLRGLVVFSLNAAEDDTTSDFFQIGGFDGDPTRQIKAGWTTYYAVVDPDTSLTLGTEVYADNIAAADAANEFHFAFTGAGFQITRMRWGELTDTPSTLDEIRDENVVGNIGPQIIPEPATMLGKFSEISETGTFPTNDFSVAVGYTQEVSYPADAGISGNVAVDPAAGGVIVGASVYDSPGGGVHTLIMQGARNSFPWGFAPGSLVFPLDAAIPPVPGLPLADAGDPVFSDDINTLDDATLNFRYDDTSQDFTIDGTDQPLIGDDYYTCIRSADLDIWHDAFAFVTAGTPSLIDWKGLAEGPVVQNILTTGDGTSGELNLGIASWCGTGDRLGEFVFTLDVNIGLGPFPSPAGNVAGSWSGGLFPTHTGGSYTMDLTYSFRQPTYHYNYEVSVIPVAPAFHARYYQRIYPRGDGLGIGGGPRATTSRSMQGSNRVAGGTYF